MSTYASCNVENGQIILNVTLSHSFEDWQKLQAAGKPPVAPVAARILVDTGASCSCICFTKLDDFKKAGLQPKRTISIITPSTGKTPANRDVYDLGLLVAGHQNMQPHFINSVHFTETDFSAQNIDGLLGMDILQHCHISFSGLKGTCFLSFHDIIMPVKTNKVPPSGLEGDSLREALS